MSQNKLSKLGTEVSELPEKALSHAGFEFYPRDKIWRLADQSRSYYIDFNKVRSYCHPKFFSSFQRVLFFYTQNYSAGYSHGIFYLFLSFLRSTVDDGNLLSSINSTHLINYNAGLPAIREWQLGNLAAFIKKWYELGYLGIETDAISFFKQIRLKGTRKGDAVRTMDPEKGPYTEIELHSIQAAINDAFGTGRITIREYILIWLFMALGARNIQVAALKLKDFNVQHASDGSSSYLLNVPRAKQRVNRIRDQFKQRVLIEEIGVVLETWIEHVKDEYLKLSKHYKKQSVDYNDLPLFPLWGNPNPVGFDHHSTGLNLAKEVKELFYKIIVISERTGKAMHINIRRFRYTLGTRAAMEGHGELIIADLLDHSDTQHVGVYVEATPEIIERIDKAVAMQLAPMAQAFMGKIILNESKAKRSNDPSSRIRIHNGDPGMGFVGNCGKYGFCNAFAPIACYTCRNFQAWLDGPHTEILESLISERERLLKETDDERIAFANDRTIMAVAEVVRRCAEMKLNKKASS